jgi:hypothetical protein
MTEPNTDRYYDGGREDALNSFDWIEDEAENTPGHEPCDEAADEELLEP